MIGRHVHGCHSLDQFGVIRAASLALGNRVAGVVHNQVVAEFKHDPS